MAERVPIFDDVIFNCTVIDCPKNTGVKRYGVRRIATLLVPCLVCFHYLGGQTVKHDVLVFSELLEAV